MLTRVHKVFTLSYIYYTYSIQCCYCLLYLVLLSYIYLIRICYTGILPMLDPPRRDTGCTIANLLNAGIEVKMITGDHLNIAKETAR